MTKTRMTVTAPAAPPAVTFLTGTLLGLFAVMWIPLMDSVGKGESVSFARKGQTLIGRLAFPGEQNQKGRLGEEPPLVPSPGEGRAARHCRSLVRGTKAGNSGRKSKPCC